MADVAARIGELKTAGRRLVRRRRRRAGKPQHRSRARRALCRAELRAGDRRSAVPIRCPPRDAIAQRFFAEHERAYGFHNPADPIEIVNFRLTARSGSCASPPTRPRRAAQVRRGRACVAPQGLVRGRCRAGHAGLRPCRAAARRHHRGSGGDRAARLHHAALPGRPRHRRSASQPHGRTAARASIRSRSRSSRTACKSIADETYIALMKSAYSTNIKERHDHSTAIIDPARAADRAGRELAGDPPRLDDGPDEHAAREDAALATCARATSSSPTTRTRPAARTCPTSTWRCRCSPTASSSASCATSRIMPTSAASRRAAWRAAPRSIRKALRIPVIRLFRAGELQSDMLDLLLLNARVPEERRGDYFAQVAACRLGVRRVGEMIEARGVPTARGRVRRHHPPHRASACARR